MTKSELQNLTAGVDVCNTASATYESALETILERIPVMSDTECLPIRDSLYRVTSQSVIARQNVPINKNSAMDGYACRYADLSTSGKPSTLKLVGTAAAGNPFNDKLAPGECIRILTGGVVPDELDTVIMQEDCEVRDNQVSTNRNHRQGQHVRNAGEDITAGETAVAAGTEINVAELGLLASVGARNVAVFRKPKVAFFSTGDELKAVSETLGPGDVYDSNRYTLYASLKSCHVEPIDLGVVCDNLGETITRLEQAASEADVIITSAGASVGDSDFVKQALEALGELTFWKVLMKPGRPLAFGKINQSWFFGLPGNPVSVVVTFDKFVRPALRKLRGERTLAPLRLNARLSKPIFKSPGRLEFQRGILSFDAEGNATVESTGNQSSGVLTSMSRANCYIVLSIECGNVEIGSTVIVEPFATEI